MECEVLSGDLGWAMLLRMPASRARHRGAFPITRPSAIAGMCSKETVERARAFEIVTLAYWKPTYKYVRFKWSASRDKAEDLTQDFFTAAYEKRFLEVYDVGRGRFRTFFRT